MRRICTILAVVLFAGTLALGQQAKPLTAHGPIVYLDAHHVSINAVERHMTLPFSVRKDTQITKAGKAITIADLKKGDNVTITYTEQGDPLPANTIVVDVKSPANVTTPPNESKK
jgi:hypothetical protein